MRDSRTQKINDRNDKGECLRQCFDPLLSGVYGERPKWERGKMQTLPGGMKTTVRRDRILQLPIEAAWS